MERIRDGYSLALGEAREWSPTTYLESVDAIYRRDGKKCSTSIVTTSRFYLERNRDETEALYKSIAIIKDMIVGYLMHIKDGMFVLSIHGGLPRHPYLWQRFM